MTRASSVLPAGAWDRSREADHVALTHDGRHRRRIAMRGTSGLEFLLDLADAKQLRDGDGLVLEDGRIVRVVAAPEPIAEITAKPHLLSRVAWHIGNRHVPAQILPDRIRIGRDHVLEDMIANLGAEVARIEAPFDPEPGAYAGEGRSHGDADHAHEHGHGHPHTHPHRHEH
jgi:urease accessory protein